MQKSFANDKAQPEQSMLDVGAQDKALEQDGVGTRSADVGAQASGHALGQNTPLDAARAGNKQAMQAIHAMGPGAAMALLYQPVASDIASQLLASTGEDVSAVQVAENPALVQQGKRGVARDGRCVEVAPGLLGDRALCFHELVHIVQQRGPRLPPAPSYPILDPEAEAIAGSKAICANQPFKITVQSSQKELFQDDSCDTSGCDPVSADQPKDLQVDVGDTGGGSFDKVPLAEFQDFCLEQNRDLAAGIALLTERRDHISELLAAEGIFLISKDNENYIQQIDSLNQTIGQLTEALARSEQLCTQATADYEKTLEEIEQQISEYRDQDSANLISPKAALSVAIYGGKNPQLILAGLALCAGVTVINYIARVDSPEILNLLRKRDKIKPILEISIALERIGKPT